MGDKANIDNEPYTPAPGNPPAYTPGPPGQQFQPGPSTVVISQPAMVAPAVVPIVFTQNVGPKPMRTTCKSCHAEITTRVEPKTALKTHLLAGLLCLFGCWCCVCIPYCTDSCRNMDHYCPNCNSYLGGYIL